MYTRPGAHDNGSAMHPGPRESIDGVFLHYRDIKEHSVDGFGAKHNAPSCIMLRPTSKTKQNQYIKGATPPPQKLVGCRLTGTLEADIVSIAAHLFRDAMHPAQQCISSEMHAAYRCPYPAMITMSAALYYYLLL